MKQFFRSVRAWGINIGMSALGVAGLIYGIPWAKNIYLFLAWVTIFLVIIAWAATAPKTESARKSRKEIRARPLALPRWASVGWDIFTILLLAGTGRFIVAGFMVIEAMMYDDLFYGKDEDEAEPEKAPA